ncbi:nitroreductase family protein [Candidatus Nomurabacteria bacterium]|nr:nitroreductase family protein [Candidatus Nomurabacteria bacterium]
MKTVNNRTTKYPIEDIFLKRFSPRAMSAEIIYKDELMTLFEAARWAPSASNIQPWRFIYAMKGTPEFEKLISIMIPFNKEWCIRASVLVLVVSHNLLKDTKISVSHSFDTGAAWENLALQASMTGFIAHGMAGFNYAIAKKEFNVPEDYSVEMMIAIGKPGKIVDLPEPLRARETPSDRKPLEEIVFEGKFPS